jgi:hypothetical protein
MATTKNETFLQKAQKTAKQIAIKLMLALLIALVAFVLFAYYGSYSTGIRAGKVIKVSKRGIIFKTLEGQLDLESFGAIKSSVNQFSQTFEFSVINDAVAKELEQVALTGERVNLHYVERYVALPWRGETRYFITKVERK